MPRLTTLPIGKNVRAVRQAQGYSLTELARRANVSKAYLSQVENYPAKQPSAAIVYRLALALQVSVTVLMGVENSADDATDQELPVALRLFWAENPSVPAADIVGLANLTFHGWSPATPTDYWLIYESIRSTAAPYQPAAD